MIKILIKFLYYDNNKEDMNNKDFCFMKNYEKQNKSIFNYVVDQSRFINDNECNNYTAPFLTYIPSGIPKMNVDIENDLKGMTRPITKCNECKYYPENDSLSKSNNIYPNNKKECAKNFNILPYGYLPKNNNQ